MESRRLTSCGDCQAQQQQRTGFDVVVEPTDAVYMEPSSGGKVKLADLDRWKVAVRVVAKLKDGTEVVMGEGMSGINTSTFPVPARHGEWTEGYSHIIANDVREIQIQTRPYEVVEFKNVPLTHK
jgi:hypothetical protein